jgi:hypothetical protein
MLAMSRDAVGGGCKGNQQGSFPARSSRVCEPAGDMTLKSAVEQLKDVFCAENKRFAWKTNFSGKVSNQCRSFASLRMTSAWL